MWFIGVEVEKETSAPPPKENPGSAPARATFIKILKQQSICQRCNEVCWIRDQSSLPHCRFLDVTQRSRKALHDIHSGGIRDQGSEARVQESKLWDQGSEGQTSGIKTTLDINRKILFYPNNPNLPKRQVKTVRAALKNWNYCLFIESQL